MGEIYEICGDDCPRLIGQSPISCTLPKGHATHRSGGTAWTRLCDEMAERLDFTQRVLAAFSQGDICDGVWWKAEGDQLRLYAICSDVFAWGTADLEEITPERLPILDQALADLLAVSGDSGIWLPELYAARIRCMRPQGAAYPGDPQVDALFDACGPERPVGLGNPEPQPNAAPATFDEEESSHG